MLLFRDEEHVDHWCAAREMARGGLLTPEQGWRLARGWYGKKLTPTWRRHTLEEAEALLAEVGLTGRFWSLRKS
jgi:Alkylmercury lyase